MDDLGICCCCLASDDLIRITEEKVLLINSFFQRELPKNKVSRICINCSNTLLCFEKFAKNSKEVHVILEEQDISTQDKKSTLDIPRETQVKLNAGFDNVLGWLSDVSLVVRQTKMKNGLQAVKFGQNSTNSDNVEMNEIKEEPIDSSFGESEEPIIEQSETLLVEDDDDLEKYRVKSKIGVLRQFKCPQCPTMYFLRNELKYHFNLHKGVTPFKCIVKGCSEAKISPHLIAQHCKRVHKINKSAKYWTNQGRKSPVASNSQSPVPSTSNFPNI